MSVVVSPIGTICFPKLVEPDDFQGNGKYRFSVTVAFDHGTDLSVFKEAFAKAARDKWKTRPQGLKIPIQPCSVKAKEDGSLPDGFDPTGHFLRAWRSDKYGPIPCVDGGRNVIDPAEVYGGCRARVAVRVYAYDTCGNRGIGLSLESIQKVADGAPLGGAGPVDPEAVFDVINTESVKDLQFADDSSPF